MSNVAAPASPLDDLPPSDIPVGRLGEPEAVDASDDGAARQAAEAAGEDASAQGRVDARTQQGQMKTDTSVAADRVKRRMRQEAFEDAKLEDVVKKHFASDADGYFDVIRTHPLECPSIERGWLGTIKPADIAASSANELLKAMYGGGGYSLIAKRGDGMRADVLTPTVTIGGVAPKMRTNAGKAWWRKAEREGTLDEPPAPAKSDEGGESVMQVLVGMMERDKERDRLRADADAARRKEESDERKREWEAAQSAEKHRRELEITELKTQREREKEEAKAQREREREDAKTLREQEAALFKSRMDAQIKQIELDAAARLEQQKLDAEVERDRRKMLLDNESRQLEMRQTGGMGFEGMGKIREMLAEAVGKSVLKGAGIEDEEESGGGIAGAIADTLRSEAPGLLQKAADVFLPKLAGWMGGQATPPPAPQQVPHNAPRQLPPPPAAPPDVSVPDFSTGAAPPAQPVAQPPAADVPPGEESAELAPQGVPTREVAGRAAAQYALGSVLQFIRPLGVLALAQPEPAAAWDATVGGNGETLADFYRLMPKNARETAATDWPKFIAAVREASPGDAKLWEDAVAQDGVAEWVTEFMAAGPWVPEETDAR